MEVRTWVTVVLVVAMHLATAVKDKWEEAIQHVLTDHDPRIPPNFEKDYPAVITVQLYIVSFDSISEASMDYSMTVFLRQNWTDSRMTYDYPEVDILELDTKVIDEVWVPDLYFTNEKNAFFHDVTTPNKLLHIYPNGNLLYSSRISMTLSCDMDLQKFPFDTQICSVAMESYSYSTKNVVFLWDDEPILRRANLKLPQFEFVDTTTLDCTKEYPGAKGTYTCIKAKFHLARNYGYYVSQVFVPSVLIVILSWVSFWLDIDAVPARISLGLLTVLTMTTQSSNARAHLPRVSYIKAIDVWMAVCLFFVFAALMEFAYVNVNARVEKRRTNKMTQNQGGLRLEPCPAVEEKRAEDSEDTETKKPSRRLFSKYVLGRARARRLDKLSRYLFPLIFVGFNAFYWIFYMFWEVPLDEN